MGLLALKTAKVKNGRKIITDGWCFISLLPVMKRGEHSQCGTGVNSSAYDSYPYEILVICKRYRENEHIYPQKDAHGDWGGLVTIWKSFRHLVNTNPPYIRGWKCMYCIGTCKIYVPFRQLIGSCRCKTLTFHVARSFLSSTQAFL